jgi:photosystem II stability/assembly factor-like uncharacterized protein
MNSTWVTNARRMGLALAVASLIWPMAAIAEVEANGSVHASGWKSVGPAIAAAIAAHVPSHTIYIGSLGGGVLKSTDGGSRFAADDLSVFGFALDPVKPNVLYASTTSSVFKTKTAGE